MLKFLGVLLAVGAIISPMAQYCLCKINPQTDEELLKKIKELESEVLSLKFDKQALIAITKDIDTAKADLRDRVSEQNS